MSLGAKKAGQAEQKRVHEINMKIKKAEKNTKLFFSETKKILEKQDEEPIFPELPESQAMTVKFAEKEKRFIRYLYTCYKAATSFEQKLELGAHMSTPLHLLYKNEYVSFIRFICKDINE